MALKPIGGEDVVGRTIKAIITGHRDDVLVFEDGTFCTISSSTDWDGEAESEIGTAEDAAECLLWEPGRTKDGCNGGLPQLQTHEEWEARMAEQKRQREVEAERVKAAQEARELKEYARLKKKYDGRFGGE